VLLEDGKKSMMTISKRKREKGRMQLGRSVAGKREIQRKTAAKKKAVHVHVMCAAADTTSHNHLATSPPS
jgi:hypothetical protein